MCVCVMQACESAEVSVRLVVYPRLAALLDSVCCGSPNLELCGQEREAEPSG